MDPQRPWRHLWTTPKDVLQSNIFGSFQKKMSFVIFNRTLASTIVIPYLEKIEFATKIGLILFAASSVQHFVTKNHWSDVANCNFTNAFLCNALYFLKLINDDIWKQSGLKMIWIASKNCERNQNFRPGISNRHLADRMRPDNLGCSALHDV